MKLADAVRLAWCVNPYAVEIKLAMFIKWECKHG